MNDLEFLYRVRSRIDTPEKWQTGWLGHYETSDAPVCVIGAGMSVLHSARPRTSYYRLTTKARKRLSKLLDLPTWQVGHWNDQHWHKAVLKRLDKAIARAERKAEKKNRRKAPWGWGPLAKTPIEEIAMNREIDEAIEEILASNRIDETIRERIQQNIKEHNIPVGVK